MSDETNKISKEYSKAIQSDANSIVSNTGNAKFADYTSEDLDLLPAGVAESSFGCGNPLSFSEVGIGDVVLDLGCGAGLDLLIASEMVGDSGRVIGVDFNENMISLAKKRTQDYGNIELIKGRIEELPVKSNSVDWVISNCVINLTPNKKLAFKEIARVMKPNGKMVVSDIVAEDLPWWVRRSGVLTAACGGGVISETQYLEGLSSVGLQNAKVIGRQHYDPSQLASIVLEAAPKLFRSIRCCGIPILQSILTRLARPVSENLWSAKITASRMQV